MRAVLQRAAGAIVLAVAAFLLALLSPLRHEASDPRGTLLTAQALLQHGGLRLDAWPDAFPAGDINFAVVNGHRYYVFPPGTAILALPFVAVARALGLDMARPPDDHAVQNIASAAAVAAIAWVLVLLCRRHGPARWAHAIAAAYLFGTGIASTLGTALWNFDFEVLLLLLALHIALPLRETPRPLAAGAALGLTLFLAFLCRPTAAPGVALLLAYALATRPRAGLAAAGVAALGLAGYMAFNRAEFGTLFPAYYSPQRWGAAAIPLGLSLYGWLFSPSRGLLVYCPQIAVAIAAALALLPRLRREPAYWMALLWVGVNALAAAGFTRWWGGHAFGPRTACDSLPPLLLLTLLAARQAAAAPAGLRRATAWTFAAAALVAIAMHSGQGLLNPAAKAWNESPDVDAYPELVFDGRHPQWLATKATLEERQWAWYAERLPALTAGDIIPAEGRLALYAGWRDTEYVGARSVRRIGRAPASILFRAAPDLAAVRGLRLRLGADAAGAVTLRLDGRPLGTLQLSTGHTRSRLVPLPANALADVGPHRLELTPAGAAGAFLVNIAFEAAEP